MAEEKPYHGVFPPAFSYNQKDEIETNAQGGMQSKIKERCELFDTDALLRTARVLSLGAERYAEDNWRQIPTKDHVGRAIRHLLLYTRKKRLNIQDGEDELAHAMCRVMFAMGVENERRV